jgi:hypothetical protein
MHVMLVSGPNEAKILHNLNRSRLTLSNYASALALRQSMLTLLI